MTLRPVLEIGGTHVTAALVDLVNNRVACSRRTNFDSQGSSADVLTALARAAQGLPATSAKRWGIAIPGPFDYRHGIGHFQGVAKLESLDGVNVNFELWRRLNGVADEFVFVNDADAFGLGEWSRLPPDTDRAVFLTLGTGIGSSFIEYGRPAPDSPGAPPHGWVYLLEWDGRPIEESVSRRALIETHRQRSGLTLDVHEIAERARAGDACANGVFATAFEVLGRCLAPVIDAFGAKAVVIGGSIARSWDLVLPPFEAGLAAHAQHDSPCRVRILPAVSEDLSPLIGAARAAAIMDPAPLNPIV